MKHGDPEAPSENRECRAPNGKVRAPPFNNEIVGPRAALRLSMQVAGFGCCQSADAHSYFPSKRLGGATAAITAHTALSGAWLPLAGVTRLGRDCHGGETSRDARRRVSRGGDPVMSVAYASCSTEHDAPLASILVVQEVMSEESRQAQMCRLRGMFVRK